MSDSPRRKGGKGSAASAATEAEPTPRASEAGPDALERIAGALERIANLLESGASIRTRGVAAARAPVAAAVAATAVGATSAGRATGSKASSTPAATAPDAASSPAQAASADSEGASAPLSPDLEPILEILVDMFDAAGAPEPEETWERLMELMHPAELEAPRALANLKSFSWKSLRRSVSRYLASADPASFHVTRTVPAVITPQVDFLKVYIRGEGRSPAPVSFRLDKSDGTWRISQISL